jgi:hypothetical protein
LILFEKIIASLSFTMDDNEKGLPVEPKTDGPVVSGSDEFSSDGAVDHYIDPAAEKRLIVKLDLYLAPVMTLIFLAAYLDRANIGNAASAGMTADLHMTSGQLGSKYFILRPKSFNLLIKPVFRCRDSLLRPLCCIRSALHYCSEEASSW